MYFLNKIITLTFSLIKLKFYLHLCVHIWKWFLSTYVVEYITVSNFNICFDQFGEEGHYSNFIFENRELRTNIKNLNEKK